MFSRLFLFYSFILTISVGETISGTVKNDANGKSIPNANIYIVETKQGTVTDPYDSFSNSYSMAVLQM